MRHLKPILTIPAIGMLGIGFHNCGDTEFGQLESQSVGEQTAPSGLGAPLTPPGRSESAGDSCIDNSHLAMTMYRCDTKWEL